MSRGASVARAAASRNREAMLDASDAIPRRARAGRPLPTLEALGWGVRLSADGFRRAFGRTFGVTPAQFYRALRVRARLLEDRSRRKRRDSMRARRAR